MNIDPNTLFAARMFGATCGLRQLLSSTSLKMIITAMAIVSRAGHRMAFVFSWYIFKFALSRGTDERDA